MVMSAQTQRRESGTAPQTQGAKPTPKVDPKQALRGMPFDEQEKALTPPVPVKSKSAEAAPAPAGPAEAPAADAPLGDADVARAMTLARYWPLPPETMLLLQRKLNVTESMVLDRETVQGIARYKLAAKAAAEAAPVVEDTAAKAKPKPKRKPKVDKDAQAKLGVPDRDWIKSLGLEIPDVKLKLGKSNKGTKESTPAEDAGCGKLKPSMTYNQYLASLNTMEFLGKTVTCHPLMLKRLAAAERFLMAKNPEAKDPTELAARLGITRVGSLRISGPGKEEANHGIGFAVDLNPGTNPWVFGNTGRSTQNKAFPVTLGRVAAFIGKGESLDAGKIAAMSAKMTTTEIVEKLGGVDAALREYRALSLLDDATLKTKIDERMSDPNVKKLHNAKDWLKKIRFDQVILTKYINDQGDKPEERGNKTAGFLDLSAQVVQAMRDVAGLRWGGSDLGSEQNGDFMHFDAYGVDGTCTNLRTDIKAASDRLKKEAAPKKDEAKA